MFVDEVTVKIKAGDGGNGCIAFRREKYVEFGGPYGGNGGKGSDIIFKVDEGLSTLIDLRYQKEVKGKKGANGLGKGKHGKKAEDVIIKVPLGTVITDLDTDLIIADLTQNNDSVVIAEGGRGGRGNIAFATGNNPAPSLAENGEPGEERNIKVEIKLLADVGLVGMPSVGKSTIISKISAAKPKIASYHFTTLKPNLGVVETKSKNAFVVADLPGLIKGASLGEGLGDRFLRHIERTRIIGHVIDMSGLEGRDPYQDYLTINQNGSISYGGLQMNLTNRKILSSEVKADSNCPFNNREIYFISDIYGFVNKATIKDHYFDNGCFVEFYYESLEKNNTVNHNFQNPLLKNKKIIASISQVVFIEVGFSDHVGNIIKTITINNIEDYNYKTITESFFIEDYMVLAWVYQGEIISSYFNLIEKVLQLEINDIVLTPLIEKHKDFSNDLIVGKYINELIQSDLYFVIFENGMMEVISGNELMLKGVIEKRTHNIYHMKLSNGNEFEFYFDFINRLIYLDPINMTSIYIGV